MELLLKPHCSLFVNFTSPFLTNPFFLRAQVYMTTALLLRKSKEFPTSNHSIVSPKSLAILPPFRGKQCTVTITSLSTIGGHHTLCTYIEEASCQNDISVNTGYYYHLPTACLNKNRPAVPTLFFC